MAELWGITNRISSYHQSNFGWSPTEFWLITNLIYQLLPTEFDTITKGNYRQSSMEYWLITNGIFRLSPIEFWIIITNGILDYYQLNFRLSP